MKIGRLLFLSGMSRNAFDNFERRGHLAFLKTVRRKGVDRFDYCHAIGLAAFWRFRELGMDPPRIAEILDDPIHWRAICTVAADEPPELYRIGVLFDGVGRLVLEGDRRRAGRGAGDLGGAFVDIVELDRDLRPQLLPDDLSWRGVPAK